MNEEEHDELLSSRWYKYLLIATLTASGAGNVVSLQKDTSDRFKGADFQREIAYRDHRISDLERWASEHSKHSAEFTQRIVENTKDLERVERYLEEHMKEHRNQ